MRHLTDPTYIADPQQLWRLSPLTPLSDADQARLDMGVALRRYASHIQRLNELAREKKSLLITPLRQGSASVATKVVETPVDHQWLRDERAL